MNYFICFSTYLASENRAPTPRKLTFDNRGVAQYRSFGYHAFLFTFLDVRQAQTARGIEAVSQRL